MTRPGKLALFAAVLLVLALAGAVALTLLFDAGRYRGVIEQRASQAIGREVRLGDVRLTFLPGIGLDVDRLTVAGLPEDSGDLLLADGLHVGARLLPLLRGRLEITSAEVVRPHLRLTRDAGGEWNVTRLLADRERKAPRRPAGTGSSGGARGDGDEADGGPGPRRAVSIDRLRFRDGRVSLTDAAAEPPIELVLEGVDLTLDDLAAGASVGVRLETRFAGATGGRLRLAGEAGPLGSRGEPFPLRAEATASALGSALLTGLGHFAGVDLATPAGRLDAVSGRFEVDALVPRRTTLRGDLDLGRVAVDLPADEGRRAVSLEIGVRFDLAAENGTDALRIDSLEVDVDQTTLALEGTLDRAGPEARRVDLALLPVQLPADRLAAFLELALPDLPFSFSSPQPLEIEARVRGLAGPQDRPEVEGRLVVSDLRFEHPAMALPIEHVSAAVAFTGESLAADGFEAVVGESDLRGEIRVESFVEPRVRFALSSRAADLDQLFGALGAADQPQPGRRERGRGAGGGGGAAGGERDVLDRVEAEGRIQVERATWGELETSDLDATVRLSSGAVTLDPLSAGLYGGRFIGRADARPGRSPLPFQLAGRADDVRVDEFLAHALGLGDRLAGRFSGTVRASGSAGEWRELASSLEGRGEMRIEEGRVQSFPLLRTVAEVAGVFGEETIARIASRLSDTTTSFAILRGDFRMDDGVLSLEEVALESDDFALRGSGSVDLVSAAIRGAGVITFSRELSELMRREGSRAGELFWSAREGSVTLPLELRGALSDPSALVDWEAAVKGFAGRRIEGEIQRQVDRLLDRLRGPQPTPSPTPQSPQ